jgi:GTP-binding protein HflX
LLSDTVGFIRDLPHHLVASFKATLEETRQARLLLHVVDAASPVAEDHILAVNRVLDEIGCKGKPTLLVLNKIDRVTDRSYIDVLKKHHPHSVCISAAKGKGLAELEQAVIDQIGESFALAEIETSAANGKVLSYLGAHAEIHHQEYLDNRVRIRCHLPRHLIHHIEGNDVSVKFVNDEV